MDEPTPDIKRDPNVQAYRMDRLEEDLKEETRQRQNGDDKNAEDMGKVRVALYTLSGGVVLACISIIIGQILLKGSP